MEIKGYKYNTQKEAQQSVDALNQYWDLPTKNGLSQFNLSMFNTYGGGYWCASSTEWYLPVWGQPFNFTIPDPN